MIQEKTLYILDIFIQKKISMEYAKYTLNSFAWFAQATVDVLGLMYS